MKMLRDELVPDQGIGGRGGKGSFDISHKERFPVFHRPDGIVEIGACPEAKLVEVSCIFIFEGCLVTAGKGVETLCDAKAQVGTNGIGAGDSVERGESGIEITIQVAGDGLIEGDIEPDLFDRGSLWVAAGEKRGLATEVGHLCGENERDAGAAADVTKLGKILGEDGEPRQHHVERARRLAGADHVAVQRGEDLAVDGERIRQRGALVDTLLHVREVLGLDAAVLHEDELLLAVAKPRGLPTMPAGGLYLEHTLLAVVRRRAPGASPMHRLGRDTSGVVLFARTAAAAGTVQAAFRARRVTKVYRALCAGHPALDAFTVDAPIGEVDHPLLGTVHAAAAGGRQARSHVRVLERRGDVSAPPSALVEVEIETGRPHQIRIHLAHAGHPLVGDPLFGPGGVPRPGTRALPGDPGYLLHAWRLELEHPGDGRRLVIECAPPPALRVGRAAGPGGVGAVRRPGMG